MSATDISYEDAIAGFNALCKEIGPKAQAYVSLDFYQRTEGHFLSVCIYPAGITGDSPIGNISATAGTLLGLLSAAQECWSSRRDAYHERRIVEMSVAIIRITDLAGSCHDAALRSDGFSDREIADFGHAACARANKMSARAPFMIFSAGKSNGAPIEEAA